jgi:PKD repeat protein
VLPANSEWQILFNIKDTNDNVRTAYVAVSTIPPNSPATPAFTLGRRDPRTGGAGTIDTGICTQSATSTCSILSGTTTKDGTITFKLNTGNVVTFGTANSLAVDPTPFNWDARNAGTKLSSIGGNTYLLVGAGAGLLETVQTTGVTGTYTRSGNVSCSNKPPVAVLSANPLSGNAPLLVNFDASASNEPTGACGTINSYTLDFGDGTTPVSQASPNFSHTYNNPGFYTARLTVADTVGQLSTNLAQQVITVTSAAAPQLSSVDSVMTHGAAGNFSVNLPLTGTRGVECRSSAAMGAGNYMLVYTFAHNLVSVDSATVVSGAAMISSSAIGPNANQYTVNLSGVTNAQYVTIGLVNAHDSTGVIGIVFGSLGVLIGDINGVSGVSGSDVNLCKAQVGFDLSPTTFRNDINANGSVSGSDVNLTKAQVGMVLPP